MTSAPRRVVHDFMPPALGRALARRSRNTLRFDDGYATWAKAQSAATGYAESTILEQVVRATDEVIAGRAAFERDGVTFDAIEYRWPVAGALMWRAALAGGTLRVLDFGGSLGSTFRQYSRLLDGLDVAWGVVEQPGFVAAGERYADGSLSFHGSIESCSSLISPTVGLLSSVLQYLPDPYAVLDDLAGCGIDTIVIDRTPMIEADHDVPAVQVVPASIYEASYPAWLLSRPRLTDHLRDWDVIDTFPGIEPDMRSSTGIPVRWLGLTLTRRRA